MSNQIPFNEASSPSIAIDGPFWQRVSSTEAFSQILRFLGAVAVLASMSMFLMNGWSEGNDIQRYLKLLAQTGLLTFGGVALSVGLKEFKGARLFYGLSLVSVTANFTILGALLYSVVQWDNALHNYPAALTWQAVNLSTFWPVFGGAVIVLGLLSRFSFSIFARRHAALLSAMYLLSCATLLLPVRDSLGISIVIGISMVCSSLVALRIRASDSFVNTAEAKFALATLFLAPSIMLVRAISLYQVDAVLSILMSGLALAALRMHSLQEAARTAERPSALQRLSGFIQLFLGMNIAFNAAGFFPDASGIVSFACMVVVVLSLTIEFVFSSRHVVLRQSYLTWSATFVLLTVMVLSLFESVFSTKYTLGYLSIALSSAGAFLGITMMAKKQFPTRAATSVSLAAIGLQSLLLLSHFIEAWQLNNWVILSVVGGAMIISASMLERYGSKTTEPA